MGPATGGTKEALFARVLDSQRRSRPLAWLRITGDNMPQASGDERRAQFPTGTSGSSRTRMRRGSRWRLVTLLVASALLTAWAVPAGAQQPPEADRSLYPVTQPEAPPEGTDAPYVEGEIRGFATALNISYEAARSLYYFQPEAIQMVEAAQDRFPATFAGGWLVDHDRGGALVLAFTENPDVRVAEIAADSANAARISGTQARSSLAQLEVVRERARELLDAQGERMGLFAISTNVRSNRVKLHVKQRTDAVVRELESLLQSDPIEVVESDQPVLATQPAPTLGCETYITSCNPLRGGTELQTTGNVHACTYGFNGVRRSDGQAMIFTAGHCPDGVNHSNYPVGPMWSQSLGPWADAQAVHIGYGWSSSYYVVIYPGAEAYHISHVYTGTNLYDFIVCFTGATSGPWPPATEARCGTVTDGDWDGESTNGQEFENQFRFQLSCTGGDSGSPVYSNERARGILWGCAGGYSYASYSHHVQNVTGTDIRVKP